MKKDKHTTVVIFRKFKDTEDVIAIFPYEVERTGEVMSYMHLGQHSGASIQLTDKTSPATPEEYNDLLKELEGIGYNLKVMKRINYNKYLEQCRKYSYNLK